MKLHLVDDLKLGSFNDHGFARSITGVPLMSQETRMDRSKESRFLKLNQIMAASAPISAQACRTR
jgi:hypothetical protein